jgi:hypothetical protein
MQVGRLTGKSPPPVGSVDLFDDTPGAFPAVGVEGPVNLPPRFPRTVTNAGNARIMIVGGLGNCFGNDGILIFRSVMTLPKKVLDTQQILRWLVMAIVAMVAIVVLGAILQVASFLLPYAIKGLVILLLAAIVIRLVTALRAQRR